MRHETTFQPVSQSVRQQSNQQLLLLKMLPHLFWVILLNFKQENFVNLSKKENMFL